MCRMCTADCRINNEFDYSVLPTSNGSKVFKGVKRNLNLPSRINSSWSKYVFYKKYTNLSRIPDHKASSITLFF